MTVEAVPGFGYYCHSVSEVARPASAGELAEVLERLRSQGESPVFRGAGRSYGDASTNPCGAVVELTRLNAILGMDEATGVVRLQGGVTYDQLWRYAIPRGFWPPVVPGTSLPTLGGCVAMNVHGKNGWKQGTLGDHLESITILTPEGRLERLAKGDPRFPRTVGRYGSTDPIVEMELHLKKVPSGFLDVEGFTTAGLDETLEALEAGKERWEYQVAWIDLFPSGRSAGRGVVHVANPHVPAPGEDAGFSVEAQLSAKGLLAKLPRGLYVTGLSFFTNDLGMRLVNEGKYRAAQLSGRARYVQSYVAFSFLLDFIPDWRRVYLPGGFIQYQLFVPKEAASRVLGEALARQRQEGVFSYLGVLKRHRADTRYANRYAPDGYSLALDFPVTRRNASALIRLCRGLDRLLAENGGRLYKAKDCVASLPHRS